MGRTLRPGHSAPIATATPTDHRQLPGRWNLRPGKGQVSLGDGGAGRSADLALELERSGWAPWRLLERETEGSVQKVLQKKEVMVRGWIRKPQPRIEP